MIFSITTKYEANDAFLKGRIAERFPTDYYDVGRGQWLVAYSGTSKELYIKLFPEPELALPSKDVIVLAVSGYWGHTSNDMWEWIRTKSGS